MNKQIFILFSLLLLFTYSSYALSEDEETELEDIHTQQKIDSLLPAFVEVNDHEQKQSKSFDKLGHRFTWKDAQTHCEKKGLKLCKSTEICPNGAQESPSFGTQRGFHVVPVSDSDNEWISIGSHPKKHLCLIFSLWNKKKSNRKPSWGMRKRRSYRFKNIVNCCPSDNDEDSTIEQNDNIKEKSKEWELPYESGGHRLTWSEALNKCKAKGKRLCNLNEYCAESSGGEIKAHPKKRGVHFVPIGDDENKWVSVGTSPSKYHCKTWDNLRPRNALPKWGQETTRRVRRRENGKFVMVSLKVSPSRNFKDYFKCCGSDASPSASGSTDAATVVSKAISSSSSSSINDDDEDDNDSSNDMPILSSSSEEDKSISSSNSDDDDSLVSSSGDTSSLPEEDKSSFMSSTLDNIDKSSSSSSSKSSSIIDESSSDSIDSVAAGEPGSIEESEASNISDDGNVVDPDKSSIIERSKPEDIQRTLKSLSEAVSRANKAADDAETYAKKSKLVSLQANDQTTSLSQKEIEKLKNMINEGTKTNLDLHKQMRTQHEEYMNKLKSLEKLATAHRDKVQNEFQQAVEQQKKLVRQLLEVEKEAIETKHKKNEESESQYLADMKKIAEKLKSLHKEAQDKNKELVDNEKAKFNNIISKSKNELNDIIDKKNMISKVEKEANMMKDDLEKHDAEARMLIDKHIKLFNHQTETQKILEERNAKVIEAMKRSLEEFKRMMGERSGGDDEIDIKSKAKTIVPAVDG